MIDELLLLIAETESQQTLILSRPQQKAENLVPQGAADKGVALEMLMGHLACQRAIFVGDDVTDEDV